MMRFAEIAARMALGFVLLRFEGRAGTRLRAFEPGHLLRAL